MQKDCMNIERWFHVAKNRYYIVMRIQDSYYTFIGESIGNSWFEYMVPNNSSMGLQGNSWPTATRYLAIPWIRCLEPCIQTTCPLCIHRFMHSNYPVFSQIKTLIAQIKFLLH